MKLYKYTPHINQFIRNPRLKITPIFQLNDPFENLLSDDASLDLENKFQQTLRLSRAKSKNIVDRIRKNQELCGVISLSRSKNNIILMAYYADDFRGGILEFDLKGNEIDKLLSHGNHTIKYGRVNYISNRPIEYFVSESKTVSELIPFQKHHKWRHEREIRIIGDYRMANSISIPDTHRLVKRMTDKVVVGNRAVGILEKNEDIDFNWISFWNSLYREKVDFHPLMNINPQCLTGIYLGCRYPMNEFPRDELAKFINLNKRIFSLELNPNSYSLTERNIYSDLL